VTHILIAGRPIGDYVESRFGHLFLALSDDLMLSEDDLVIRGGPDGSLIWSTLQGQVSVLLDQTNDSFANVARLLGINEVEAFNFYATGEIPVPRYDAATIWRILSDVASQVLANGFTYSALSENSNSFVGTLLSVIGIESAGTAWFRYPAVGHMLSSDFFTGLILVTSFAGRTLSA
jgi:hypothetical protein